MPSLTTIQATDLISNSRSVINTNFSLLNLAANPPQGTAQNYQIVTSVSSGNLTVALKQLDGTDATAQNPIYIRIGNTVRTITSALSLTLPAGTNWCNAGSSELATNEIDYFLYLGYRVSTTSIVIGISRYPSGRVASDFSAGSTTEKTFLSAGIDSTDEVECIGRFNATLSAGAGYTWSIPATSVIVNRPIYETRILSWTPTRTWTDGPTSSTITSNYKIVGRNIELYYFESGTANGSNSATRITLTQPFGQYYSSNNNITLIGSGSWTDNATFNDAIVGSPWYTAGTIYIDFASSTRKPTQANLYTQYLI